MGKNHFDHDFLSFTYDRSLCVIVLWGYFYVASYTQIALKHHVKEMEGEF